MEQSAREVRRLVDTACAVVASDLRVGTERASAIDFALGAVCSDDARRSFSLLDPPLNEADLVERVGGQRPRTCRSAGSGEPDLGPDIGVSSRAELNGDATEAWKMGKRVRTSGRRERACLDGHRFDDGYRRRGGC